MNREQTHTVNIEIIGRYPSGADQRSSLSIDGDGGIEHMIESFKAALVIAGFSLDTIKAFDELDV